MAAEIPRWFDAAIAEGLQALLVLYLPGAPAEETIDSVAEVWVRVLWHSPTQWGEQLDRPRLSAAFLSLARQVERWPAPRHVLDHLPRRPERVKLAAPAATPEQAARSRALVKSLLKALDARQAKRKVAATSPPVQSQPNNEHDADNPTLPRDP